MAGKPSLFRIGILALQGNVTEHIDAFTHACRIQDIPHEILPLRKKEEITGLTAIAIPGGESTTIARLIDKNGMRDAMVHFSGSYFATCAGLVLLASEIIGEERYTPLGILDISVSRNAFGRQKDSFESDINVQGLDTPFHAVFIRAPVVIRTGSHIQVLAAIDSMAVALQAGKHMAFAFHPELSGDLRLHSLFLSTLS
ncbi:MAG: pyridoxal 5'-phosphate synthase glutaminase subunit PdxT [Methanospirillaceae archaeon]|nr:pyridoxal 5'-phosphate synthase glutaminase subunit PdxT [Methanospirillaceae archaeon]